MPGYRLVEYGGGSRGANTFPRIYPEVLEATEVAERIMADLAGVAWRRPFRIDVIDVWTRETVVTVRVGVDRDRDVCPACGAPSDPFAPASTEPRNPARSAPAEPETGRETG